MKYVVLIGDGMSDHPIESIGGKTPLEAANTPNMDMIARTGTHGLFKSVPEGYPPGSDVAILSILGYDPKDYYTGRSPLEAASMGVELNEGDVAFRCNLVTLEDKDGCYYMKDYSAGHISTEEARDIIEFLDDDAIEDGDIRYYPGVSYRHLMVWSGGTTEMETVPPHDLSDKGITGHLPKGADGEYIDKLDSLTARSWNILPDHPVNVKRILEGKNPANSVWFWGEGTKPVMKTYEELYGLKGSIISAVDLTKGIGIYAGLTSIDVPGATGYIDTNYKGKLEAGLEAIAREDYLCLHVEAPDECGHQGDLKLKIQAIEDFDREIVGPMIEGLKGLGEDVRLLVLNDHPTPVELKTHVREPVPFTLVNITGGEVKGDGRTSGEGESPYSERAAKATGVVIEDAPALMREFIKDEGQRE